MTHYERILGQHGVDWCRDSHGRLWGVVGWTEEDPSQPSGRCYVEAMELVPARIVAELKAWLGY